MFPMIAFEHLGEEFTPDELVPLDHPMIAARPDLFTASPPNQPARATSPKE